MDFKYLSLRHLLEREETIYVFIMFTFNAEQPFVKLIVAMPISGQARLQTTHVGIISDLWL